MSMIYDGTDILMHYDSMAVSMSESLEKLLKGKKEKIPKGILSAAQKFLDIAMDGVRKNRKSRTIYHDSFVFDEIDMTYKLAKDILKKVKKNLKNTKQIDSELEKLAIATQALTPSGKEVAIAKNTYQTLRNFFEKIDEESEKYPTAYDPNTHSPWSVGTFEKYSAE